MTPINAATRALALAVCLAIGSAAMAGPASRLTTVLTQGAPIMNAFNTNYQWAYDPIERGHTIRFDGFWDNRTYNFGFSEITLSGNGNATFGYGLRGIPHLDWQIQTNNLQYEIQTKNGIEDLRLQGVIGGFTKGNVNLIGFYTMTLDYGNRGQLIRDGQQVETIDTSFDLGPINIRGNLVVDAVAALAKAAGADTSRIDSIVNKGLVTGKAVDLAESAKIKLAAGKLITHEELAAMTQLSVLGSTMGRDLLNDPTGSLLELAQQNIDPNSPTSDGLSVGLVPEPATLTLLAGSALALFARRRAR